MPSKQSTPKKSTAPRKRASRVTHRRTSPADQRRFLAADIAAATLAGYREGAATALAQSIISSQPTTQLDTCFDKIEWPAPVKILANGTFCNPGDARTDHVAVWIPAAGIVVHPVSLGTADGKELPNLDACITACRDLRVLDYSNWELARREDWNHIIDLTRHAPALDPNLYPGIKSEWHRTATDCSWADKDAAGRPVSAWGVLAGNGSVYNYHRGSSGFALAVRRVGQ